MDVILHIPHSSIVIPKNVRGQFVLSDIELEKELLFMTDRFTDKLFLSDNEELCPVIYPVSRIVTDPERFVRDYMEPMAEQGMGVIYSKTSHGEMLRRSISNQEKEILINTFYNTHHEKVSNIIDQHLTNYGYAFIVDCHSFSSVPLPYELNQQKDRPDICIGTDKFHTPDDLIQKCMKWFVDKGYSVKTNNPYEGAFVPVEYYKKDKNVYSMMIEINRKLYMDEFTGNKLPKFDTVKSDLEWVLDKLCAVNLDREDIYLNEPDYLEILKYAKMWYPDLGDVIAEKKEVFMDEVQKQWKYKIKKDDVDENDAVGLLYDFLDKEIHFLTSEEIRHFGHLAEAWRPLAEGPL